ncbi:MAG: hypothetical protein H0W53_10850 [Acidobacteria bacterium]|nr:hypothetical protein [Acidobacteriota bacterium]
MLLGEAIEDVHQLSQPAGLLLCCCTALLAQFTDDITGEAILTHDEATGPAPAMFSDVIRKAGVLSVNGDQLDLDGVAAAVQEDYPLPVGERLLIRR